MPIVLHQETTLAPTSIVKDSNTTGTVDDIDDPVDSPDGNKLEVVDETANYLVRFQFTPPANLSSGAGLQKFRAWVLKNEAGGNNPTCAMALAMAGSSLRALVSPVIESESGELVEGTFDIDEVINPEDTECRLDGLTSTDRNIDIDAVEWVATHDASITPSDVLGVPTLSAPTEILPVSVAPSESLGEPTLGLSIQPSSIAASEVLGEPTLSLQTFEIQPESIAATDALGEPSLGVGGEITLSSIAASATLGAPTLTIGDPLITLQSILSSAAVGVPVVRRVDVPPELANKLKPGTWRMVPGS